MIPKDKKIKSTLWLRTGRRSTAATQSQSPAVVKSNMFLKGYFVHNICGFILESIGKAHLDLQRTMVYNNKSVYVHVYITERVILNIVFFIVGNQTFVTIILAEKAPTFISLIPFFITYIFAIMCVYSFVHFTLIPTSIFF